MQVCCIIEKPIATVGLLACQRSFINWTVVYFLKYLGTNREPLSFTKIFNEYNNFGRRPLSIILYRAKVM